MKPRTTPPKYANATETLTAFSPWTKSFEIATPSAYGQGDHLGKKRKKQCCNHDGDHIVLDDAGRKYYASGKGSCEIAPGDVAQLPQVLNEIREGLAHRLGERFNRRLTDDRAHFSRRERKLFGENPGFHQGVCEGPRFRSRRLDAKKNTSYIRSVDKNIARSSLVDAGSVCKSDRLCDVLGRKGSANFVHESLSSITLWLI
jgi:hypothetical protein